MSDLIARHVVVHGRVQGVGYRDAAVKAAFEHGVTGWVRNRADGTVEVFVQGVREPVERYVAWCRWGPPLARVVDIEAAAASPESDIDTFQWLPTA